MKPNTRKAIKESFMLLLNQKPLSKITVKEIVANCGINRNSFYYHYSDIPTLLEEILIEKADAIFKPEINGNILCRAAVLQYYKSLLVGFAIDWLNDGMNNEISDRLKCICVIFDGTFESVMRNCGRIG